MLGTVPEQESTSAIKNDSGKTEFHHMPLEALEQVSSVFMFGASKYQEYNYRGGFKYSRLFNASLRHLFAFWKGENNDKESGLPHLAHAVCCILMLLQNILESKGTDNRYKGDQK